MKNVTAAILAGGLGTRLRPAVSGMPKVLARVGDRPFLAFLLDRLAKADIKKVVLLTGYQADQVRDAFGTHHGAMALHHSVEPSPLGTGGALRHALPMLDSETTLLLNGDSYCDVEIAKLLSDHEDRQADMSLTLTHVSNASQFGQVQIGQDGRVTRFVEKREGAGWINAGVYVLKRSLMEAIPDGRSVSLEREMLPAWVQSRRLFGFRWAGRFIDIGTPETYARARRFLTGAADAGAAPAYRRRPWFRSEINS